MIAKPAFPWYIAPFRSLRFADVAKILAPGIVIGLVAFAMLRDPVVLLVIPFVCLITVPMLLVRASPFKVELEREEQLNLTIELLEKTPGLQREDGTLRWTLRHWATWAQGKADEVSIIENLGNWTVVGPRLTMLSLASKLDEPYRL